MNEAIIRLSVFISVLIVIMLLEIVSPRRQLKLSRKLRWLNNLILIIINTIVLRLVFPFAAVGAALWCQINQVGVLNYLDISPIFKVIIAFVVLDFAIYLQHILFHFVPVLWRFHKVHHVDLDFDVTSGIRFHPIEMILSMLIKFAVIAVIGVPVLAVIIFEVVLNATSMFNHGNIRLPQKLDSLIRVFIVTPDMHRVHHSSIVKETNSNFGFNFAIWDKLFSTYIAQPSKGHIDMDIGLKEYKDSNTTQKLVNILKIPFFK